jgi:histone H3/H4
MMILSAEVEKKTRILKNTLKKFVKERFGVNMTDEAAEELAKIIEAKAIEISKHAIKMSKRHHSEEITPADIESYKIDSD